MADDSVIRIPLEIITGDIQDLHEIEREVDEIEKRVSKIQPAVKETNVRDRTSRSPIQTEDEGQRFGAFRPAVPDETLPTAFRDKKSKSAFNREDAFQALKKEVEEQKQRQSSINNALNNIFGIQIAGDAASNLQGLSGKIPGMLGGGMNLGALITRIVGPIAVALLAVGFAQQIMDWWFRNGGPKDLRWKRAVEKEADPAIDRAFKNDLRQGIRDIRVTASPGLRIGAGQVTSTRGLSRQGIPVYNLELEAFSKGVI